MFSIIITVVYCILYILNPLEVFKVQKEKASHMSWNEFAKSTSDIPGNWADKIFINNFLKDIGLTGPDTILMTYGPDCSSELKPVISHLKSYCVKMSNLCESIGVFIVVDGILQEDVKLVKEVVYHGPRKRGQKLSVDQLINGVEALERSFKDMTLSTRRKVCKTPFKLLPAPVGVVVERVYPPHELIKVYVIYGELSVIYNNRPKFTIPQKSKFNKMLKSRRMHEIRQMCCEFFSHVKVDILRIDFMVPDDIDVDIRINEITLDPTANFHFGMGPYIHLKQFLK